MNRLILYCIAAIFVLVPVAAVRPMVSLFAEQLGASMLEIGILTACYSLTPLFIAVFAGRFIDRFGEKLPLLIGAGGMVLALIIPFFLPSIPFIYVSHLLLGGSQFLAFIAVQNGVIISASENKSDQAIATVSLFTSVGLMLGPMIGGYSTEHLGFQHSYLLYCILAIVLLVAGLLIKPVISNRESRDILEKQKVKDLISIPGLKRNIFISMLILASLDIFYVYFPLYASSIGKSPSEIGWILMVQSLSSVLTRMFLTRLVNRWGKIQVLSVFMFSGAVAYSVIPFFEMFSIFIIIAAIVGTGLGIVQPLTIMIAYNLAPEKRSAEVLGIRLAANRLSQVVIPLVFAIVSLLTGLGAIFTIQAVSLGAGALFARGIKAK
jgi:predicted MFS family arabinose efflux permease